MLLLVAAVLPAVQRGVSFSADACHVLYLSTGATRCYCFALAPLFSFPAYIYSYQQRSTAVELQTTAVVLLGFVGIGSLKTANRGSILSSGSPSVRYGLPQTGGAAIPTDG